VLRVGNGVLKRHAEGVLWHNRVEDYKRVEAVRTKKVMTSRQIIRETSPFIQSSCSFDGKGGDVDDPENPAERARDSCDVTAALATVTTQHPIIRAEHDILQSESKT
jgi:hypothetical protein